MDSGQWSVGQCPCTIDPHSASPAKTLSSYIIYSTREVTRLPLNFTHRVFIIIKYDSKTDSMECSKNDEPVEIVDNKEYRLNQVETLKYLGSYVNAKGRCDEDVKNRIAVAWQKWKEVVYD